MLRNLLLAGTGVVFLSFGAAAQPARSDATAAPSQLQPSQPGAPDAQSADQESRDDLFCRRDAAARTGYRSPGEVARDEQARDTVGGTVLGAAAGALIGSANGHAGAGAAIGAGAGLLAGSAVGADNARVAANDTEQRYGAAYYQCMAARSGGTPPPGDYADNEMPPPPPPYPYAYGPYPYYDYPPPYYYGYGPVFVPSVRFGFGFGGGGWNHGGGWHH